MAASGGPDAANILQALQVALDVTGTDREKRKAATDFLEQVHSSLMSFCSSFNLFFFRELISKIGWHAQCGAPSLACDWRHGDSALRAVVRACN
jgi:hypothetical protein